MVDYYRSLGVPADRVRLLYNDINTSRYANVIEGRSLCRESLAVSADELLVLFVHRFSPVRRCGFYFEHIFSWVKRLDANVKIRLILVGDGPEEQLVKKLALDCNLTNSVQFLGARPNQDLDRYYAAADLFIHPTFNEGFPRVLIEAMAARLPVVSTDAGGARDIAGPLQQQYICSRDDPLHFVALLNKLVFDEQLRRLVATENFERVRRFDTKVVAAMYEEVLFE